MLLRSARNLRASEPMESLEPLGGSGSVGGGVCLEEVREDLEFRFLVSFLKGMEGYGPVPGRVQWSS